MDGKPFACRSSPDDSAVNIALLPEELIERAVADDLYRLTLWLKEAAGKTRL